MTRFERYVACVLLSAALVAGTDCGGGSGKLEPPETFHWVDQRIVFSPPPSSWRREGENGGGTLGVRFVLTGGVGECIMVVAYQSLAERDRREALARLLARRDSLARREFLRELSLARARTDDPVSDREATAAMAINEALDRTVSDYLGEGRDLFVKANLEEAIRAAEGYEPSLAELLPRIQLRPESRQEPDRWRLGYQRDTTMAGHPAFAGDDTLITPEHRLLYFERVWVVNGRAFKATYQGLEKNLPVFERLMGTIQFPEKTDAPTG